MKEGRTLSQPVKQEGQEQVCEQEAAQTGHLQSSSGTSRAPRAARAARGPGPLLQRTAVAPRALCPSGSGPGQRDQAAAQNRANTPAQEHRNDSASRPQPACGRAKSAIRRPQLGAPYPGNTTRGLRVRSLGAGGHSVPDPAVSVLQSFPRRAPPRPAPAAAS